MSKYLKSIITACLVVCMTVCLGIFAAACDDKPAEATFPSSVSITVVRDANTPVAGVTVQLCFVKDGVTNGCLNGVSTNEQGVATVEIDEEAGNIYEIHLTLGIPAGYKYVDKDGTPYEEGKGMRIDVTKNASITITLVQA